MNIAQRMSHRSRLRPLLAGTAALAAVGLVDCTAMQVLRGGFDASRTALWLAVTLVPLAVASFTLALTDLRPDLRTVALRFTAFTALVLLVLVAADLLVFPSDQTAEWLDRARSKLPGAAAFVGLGIAAKWWGRQGPETDDAGESRTQLVAADAAAIAAARVVRAAGNYVEAESPSGQIRLIRLPIGRVEGLPHARGLVRVHRSLLVRASAVAEWHNDRSGLVGATLDDGKIVSIGRKYRRTAYELRNFSR